MKKLASIIILVLLLAPISFAQQSPAPSKPPVAPQPEPRIVSLSNEAQATIQQIFEEQRLINAKLEGAILIMRAILGVAPECRPQLDIKGKLQFVCPAVEKPADTPEK